LEAEVAFVLARKASYSPRPRLFQEGQWVPIGKAYNRFGDFTLDEGKDWLP